MHGVLLQQESRTFPILFTLVLRLADWIASFTGRLRHADTNHRNVAAPMSAVGGGFYFSIQP